MPNIPIGQPGLTGQASGAARPAAANNAFNGVPPPDYITGTYYLPQYFLTDGTNQATTATRLYYCPIYIWQARTFAGAITYNQGAGDNGEVYRVGLYTHSASQGPTTLVKDFGEVTLTGASAVRTLSNSVTISTVGWYWLATHFNSAAAMYSMVGGGAASSNVGYYPTLIPHGMWGVITPSIFGSGVITGYRGRYVDTAYGAFAQTAVAPSTDNNANNIPFVALLA